MTRPLGMRWVVRAAALLACSVAGCFDEPTFGAATNEAGDVFLEGFGAGVTFQAFSGTDYGALGIDRTLAHAGKQSLKIAVPAPDAAAGSYAGGAFTTTDARDLSKYDAVTFWAMASRDVTLDVAGFGNDNTGTSKYAAQTKGLALSTTWTRFVLPIPDAKRLTAEKGLFFFAASAQGAPATGWTLWLDDVRFETLGAAALAGWGATIESGSTPSVTTLAPGATTKVKGAQLALADASRPALTFDDRYLALASSAPAVATVTEDGTVTGVAAGSATVSATLAGKPVTGSLVVNVAVADPTVIALLSASYPTHPVDTWLADWSMPKGKVLVSDAPDGADPMRTYTNMQYAGIEFFAHVAALDATDAGYLHVDVKTSDPAEIHLKLVDFGANGAADPPYDGVPHGDDAQGEIVLSPSSAPPLVADAWVTYDLPMAKFQVAYGTSPGLKTRGHLSQLVLVGPAAGTPLVGSLAIKNLYFHR